MSTRNELDRYDWESPMGSGDYDGDDYIDQRIDFPWVPQLLCLHWHPLKDKT